jgi:gliding motility-associated-like protein
MKRFLLILTLFLFTTPLFAEHITGGEMYYTYRGLDDQGRHVYRITLKLYRDCFSAGAQLDASAAIAVFNKSNNAMVWNGSVQMTGSVQRLELNTPGPCITNAPPVCYQVGYYETDVPLAPSAAGYTVAYQRCCRINGINNLVGSGNTGATYTADIPGTSPRADGPVNNSAKFTGIDTVIVCGGYPFTYSFAASDPDLGDQLRYSFCRAYLGGSSGNQAASTPNPPAPPPYVSVPYNSGYSANSPLGAGVTINPTTGLISGVSPPQGIYVVTVCVEEIRQGVVIATQRKDLQIKAGGCNVAKAQLNPQYISCDGFTLNFSNLSTSPLINSYYWEFGDPNSGINNSSNSATPTHTFSVAGDYTIKLVTNRNQECSDSTTAIVKVWPGFFPNFNSTGICLINPVFFNDATTTNYGVVDSWIWNFGDGGTSTLQNPSHNYTSIGPKDVRLIVGNSKGCVDTITNTVNIIDKPPITLAFRDTLICVPDAVQLQASGTGNFSWTPLTNIVNPNTATPTVNPTTTTTYHVRLDEQGCINTDSVRVRVVTFVTLNEMNDTTICQTDAVQLTVDSDGLQYQWSPAPSLNNPTVQDPIATAGNTATYTVIARIGSCTASKNINVTAVPYPVANAGPDTLICYNTPAYLHGSHDGSSFFWSPISTLQNFNTLMPTAYPAATSSYVLTSMDTRGCPKPGRDTVLIEVLPKIIPFAGNDTLVVVGQPLQFNAEGGISYVWTPSTGLSNPNIKNPIGLYDDAIDSLRYTVEVFNAAGCSETDNMKVTVFKTNPYVFVPTAFTPNADGLNDMVRPIAVGVQKINYFRVYNRWGQLVFSTTTNGHGWDGKIGGTPQASNVFVWMVSAIDYLGKPIFLKGTVTLIR